MSPLTFTKPAVVGNQESITGLVRQIGEGWQIEPPVYVMRHPLQRGMYVFHFVLWREGRPRIVTVQDSPEARRFVSERRLSQEPI
jgi:hypothetical protein